MPDNKSDMSMYTLLTFKNHEEFEMYRTSVDLKSSNMALRMTDCKLTALIKTELPLPTGILIANTISGKEIEIKVSSGYMVVVEEDVNIC